VDWCASQVIISLKSGRDNSMKKVAVFSLILMFISLFILPSQALTANLVISGTVTGWGGQPLAGQKIYLKYYKKDTGTNTCTGPQYNYILAESGPDGSYTMSVNAGDCLKLQVYSNTNPTAYQPYQYEIISNSYFPISANMVIDLVIPFKKVSVQVRGSDDRNLANSVVSTYDWALSRYYNYNLGVNPALPLMTGWSNDQVTTGQDGKADLWLFANEGGNQYEIFANTPDPAQYITNSQRVEVTADTNVPITLEAIGPGDFTVPTTTYTLAPAPNANGWNNSPVTVTLSATDNDGGSGVKNITYWTEGAQVIETTTVEAAQTSFTISNQGDTFVYYTATDNAGNSEAPKNLRVSVDTTTPTTTSTLTPAPNANGWNKNTVSVKLTANDNSGGSGVKSITYRTTGAKVINQTTVQNTQVTFSIGAQGTTTVYFYATDNIGNTETEKSIIVKVDTVKPGVSKATVTGGVKNGSGYYTTSPTITLSSSDATSGVATIYYQLVNHNAAPPTNTLPGGWSAYSAPFTLSMNGYYDLYAFAVDKAGNAASPVKVAMLKLSTGG
jgi:hypothetical protein